jgi:hypothetical protein
MYPLVLTNIISIKVLSHNQQTVCEEIYYLATSFVVDSRHLQDKIQECEHSEKLNTIK